MSEKSTTESGESTEERELSPEEIKQRRATLIKFYKDQNEILTLQATYEKLKADIMESIAREHLWRGRYAEMMLGPKGPPEATNETAGEQQTTGEQKPRKLKTEE